MQVIDVYMGESLAESRYIYLQIDTESLCLYLCKLFLYVNACTDSMLAMMMIIEEDTRGSI